MAVILRTVLLISFVFIVSCSHKDAEQMNITNNTNLEVQIMDIVNNHRQSLGLSALQYNEVAYVHANVHNDYMIVKGTLSHDNFNSRASNIVSETNAEEVGENVATGYISAEGVFDGWINSLEHRTNIEGDYTHTAVSARKNENDNLYFTQIFFK